MRQDGGHGDGAMISEDAGGDGRGYGEGRNVIRGSGGVIPRRRGCEAGSGLSEGMRCGKGSWWIRSRHAGEQGSLYGSGAIGGEGRGDGAAEGMLSCGSSVRVI